MTGEADLTVLLASMSPTFDGREYVFITLPGAVDLAVLTGVPVMAVVAEAEGTTVVLPRIEADHRGWGYDYVAARITLQVHSSLAAVGLTAAFAAALGRAGISCNVIAGYFHDHLYVPFDRAGEALLALQDLQASAIRAGPPGSGSGPHQSPWMPGQ